MKLIVTSSAKSLNKAYLRQSLKREQIELLKENLARLLAKINEKESEEHLKNLVADFLKDTWYKQTFEINTSGRADLAIHNGKSSTDSVGVLIEVKRPTNKTEMVSPERPNAKALHELLHYYMQERYIKGNQELKRLIVCNIYEWYLFDAVDFERFFFNNQKLVKSYKDWNDGILVGTNTDWFYTEIAKQFIENELEELPCVYFDLRDFQRADDRKLINLYKVLSPPHLLKQPFANDSNSLNKEFYSELLHIIGLEEVKEKGKKLIRRKTGEARNDGSLLENAINVLKVRHKLPALPEGEGEFDVALELCITWLNRILFLKLLEGQLIGYHKGDRSLAFLSSSRIEDFDELNELFFEVLAIRGDERSAQVSAKFGNIPYLNSSLFEETDLERTTVRINELKNRLELPLHGATVLKDAKGKRLSGNKSTLAYLFEFLDAYDFGAEGGAEIQEQNKSIINASVLGLIFEKINGYRDGSFFTPGFITMYICRETIRRAVVQKFNERYGWECSDITALYNCMDKVGIKEANETVNSLKICDPAVGSGHFLVSALNEMIAVKADLGILADSEGKRLRGYSIAIENDELIVTEEEQVFAYNFKDAESQRVQETLFHEKEAIIENCLFGVDINPKSVAICRLRLWIELLKSAYYRRGTGELETLPNIDINIKCGNSLVSRFALGQTPNLPPASRSKLKELTEKYRNHVFEYKLSPANKAQLRKVIADLKDGLLNFGLPNDKDLAALRKKENEVSQLGFAFDKAGIEAQQKLMAETVKLRERFAEKERLLYHNAFEWRFEFPEVLDEAGEFVGFDAVIGNPPYIRQEAIKEQKPAFQEIFGDFYCGTADIYTYFYKTGLNLLRSGGKLCYIAPNKFMRASYGRNTRQLLTEAATPLLVLDFGDLPVFEEATTYPSIVMVEKVTVTGGAVSKKGKPVSTTLEKEGEFLAATFTTTDQFSSFGKTLAEIGFTMPVSALLPEGWSIEPHVKRHLLKRICSVGESLTNFVGSRVYRGITTGFNEAFEINADVCAKILAENPASAEIIKPFLKGRDVYRWKVANNNTHLIFTRRGVDIENFQAVKSHLEINKVKLLPKPTSWDEKKDGTWQGRKPGSYEWYEIQDNIAYWQEFEKTKIISTKISLKPTFSLDTSGSYLGNTSYFIPVKTNEFFLLALLNSRLSDFYCKSTFVGKQNGYYEVQPEGLETFPIPPTTTAQQAPIIGLVRQILAAPDSAEVPRLEAEIDRLVYELYGLTEEEIALVESGSEKNSNNR